MVLISEVKLGSLLPIMGGKIFYLTPMSISSIKRLSKPLTPCDSYYNIKKYYCFLLKLKPKVSDIYISFIIYTSKYCFRVFSPCMCFQICKFTFTQKNHVIARIFG